MTQSGLPDIGAIVGRVLERVPESRHALLIALAERLAAARYRGWAKQVEAGPWRVQLFACADREEEIARRVEALDPDAASVQRDLLSQHPDLEAIDRTLFAGRPLDEQLAIQARGERLGASTWRAFARRARTPAERETFLACAPLEEASAACLEALLAARR
jgi:hypothetical protein